MEPNHKTFINESIKNSSLLVYVPILSAEGHSECYGVFKNKEDAMNICKKEAEKFANSFKDVAEILEDLSGFYVDCFSWRVLEMYVQ